ncbi:MAG: DUF4432 family protein [Actinobacteria bacterium]|nr:DUF4432 family protein [Actinomycetota bacterium]
MSCIRRNSGCRINDEMTYKGLQFLTMENELIKLSILVGKGTDIIELIYKPKDLNLLWRSPKNFSRQDIENNLVKNDFLETYLGGWQEIIPNGGPPVLYKGAAYGQHEETPLLAWNYKIIEDKIDKISVEFSVNLKKMPLSIKKSITLISGDPVIYIDEEISNSGGEPLDFMWGHHPCFGEPFLDESCVIDFHSEEILSNINPISSNPIVKPNAMGKLDAFPGFNGQSVNLSKVMSKKIKTAELLYAIKMLDSWFSIKNSEKNIGIGFVFDENIFKYLYLWFVYGGGDGYPWYSNTYSLAVEPWSSYPGLGLIEAINNKTSLKIMPGERINTWLKTIIFNDSFNQEVYKKK